MNAFAAQNADDLTGQGGHIMTLISPVGVFLRKQDDRPIAFYLFSLDTSIPMRRGKEEVVGGCDGAG